MISVWNSEKRKFTLETERERLCLNIRALRRIKIRSLGRMYIYTMTPMKEERKAIKCAKSWRKIRQTGVGSSLLIKFWGTHPPSPSISNWRSIESILRFNGIYTIYQIHIIHTLMMYITKVDFQCHFPFKLRNFPYRLTKQVISYTLILVLIYGIKIL
jgi:hypothetical protein